MNADANELISQEKRNSISGSISKRGMNFVVIGKCGSFYIYHEKAGKKSKSNAPQKTISSLPA